MRRPDLGDAARPRLAHGGQEFRAQDVEHFLDAMLSSLAGDLKIAETVDVPHMLVTMHMPKHIFVNAEPGVP